MGRVIVCSNALEPKASTREYAHDGPLLDWLQIHYPDGFEGAVVVASKNGLQLPVEHYDTFLGAEDVVVFAMAPANWIQVVQYVIQVLIQIAVAYAVNALFGKPKTPGRLAAASPTYSFGSAQNEARLGEPIPVIYGEVVLVPVYASQPYTYYKDNQQYLILLFAIGRGNCNVLDVLVADSAVSSMPVGVVSWELYKPADHLSTLGVIGTDFGIYENVATPIEIQDLDMQRSSDSVYDFANFTAPSTIKLDSAFPENFIVGATLTVQGTLSNDKTYTITSRSTGGRTLGVTPNVVAEVPFTRSIVAAATSLGKFEVLFVLTSNTLPAGVTFGMTAKFFPTSSGFGGLFSYGKGTVVSLNATGKSGFAEIIVVLDNPFEGDVVASVRTWSFEFDTGAASFSVGAIDDGYRGWYAVCKPTVVVDKLEVDLAWPNGLYATDDKGNYLLKSIVWIVEYQPIDNDGNVTGPIVRVSEYFTGKTLTAQRRTYAYTVPTARYRVRLRRLTLNDKNSRSQSSFFWTALKGFIPYSSTPDSVYGKTTILAVKAKATAGLSSAAQLRFRARVQRLLPTIVSGFATEAFTSNPAEVFCDILRNQEYGAAISDADLDLATIEPARDGWTGTNGFNAVFDQRSTIFDSINTAMAVNRGRLTAYDRRFGILRELPQPVNKYLFAPTVMLANSFTASYQLAENYEYDGVRVAYRDPQSFVERYVLWPSDAIYVQNTNLFGCTSAAHALGYAKYLWYQANNQRTAINFETELEGMLPELGDRVAVSHPAVNWGESMRVVKIETLSDGFGLTFEGQAFKAYGTVWAYLRDVRGAAYGPIVGEIVAEGKGLKVTSLPDFLPDLDMAQDEPMTVSFGAAEDSVKSYVLTELTTQDSRKVSLLGIRYDATLYVDTIPLPEWA